MEQAQVVATVVHDPFMAVYGSVMRFFQQQDAYWVLAVASIGIVTIFFILVAKQRKK